MKKRDDLPLNYKERLNSRTSFLVSAAVLVVLCLIFNQMDYAMIRQPAAQAKKAAEAQKQKEKENTVAAAETTTATVLAVGDNLVQPSLLSSSPKAVPGTMTAFMTISAQTYRRQILPLSIRKHHLPQTMMPSAALPHMQPQPRLATHL